MVSTHTLFPLQLLDGFLGSQGPADRKRSQAGLEQKEFRYRVWAGLADNLFELFNEMLHQHVG